jgi:predicted dehydrogenase
VPSNPSGQRLEIYGTAGTLVISGGSANTGLNHLHGARGNDVLGAMPVPERFTLVPEATPTGSARNVAQAYARLASALSANDQFTPDFAHAVKRHQLIDAIERSSATGTSVKLQP